jgi:hypothetical protein
LQAKGVRNNHIKGNETSRQSQLKLGFDESSAVEIEHQIPDDDVWSGKKVTVISMALSKERFYALQKSDEKV